MFSSLVSLQLSPSRQSVPPGLRPFPRCRPTRISGGECGACGVRVGRVMRGGERGLVERCQKKNACIFLPHPEWQPHPRPPAAQARSGAYAWRSCGSSDSRDGGRGSGAPAPPRDPGQPARNARVCRCAIRGRDRRRHGRVRGRGRGFGGQCAGWVGGSSPAWGGHYGPQSSAARAYACVCGGRARRRKATSVGAVVFFLSTTLALPPATPKRRRHTHQPRHTHTHTHTLTSTHTHSPARTHTHQHTHTRTHVYNAWRAARGAKHTRPRRATPSTPAASPPPPLSHLSLLSLSLPLGHGAPAPRTITR